MCTMSAVEKAKNLAACAAVREFVTRETKAVGIGSGSTVVYAVQELAKLVRKSLWTLIACQPLSKHSNSLLKMD